MTEVTKCGGWLEAGAGIACADVMLRGGPCTHAHTNLVPPAFLLLPPPSPPPSDIHSSL